MDIFERNKKVAINRWRTIHQKERQLVPNDKQSNLIKAALCGFLAGDGSVQKRKEKTFMHYQVDFFPDDERMKNTYISMIKRIYKKNPSTTVRDNVFNIRISSKIIVEDLLSYSNFGVKNWSLPKNIIIDQKGKINWLKAFFSAEGYVGKQHIKVQSINKQGLLDVVKMLNELEIENHFYEYYPKKENTSTVFIIMITKKEARKKYLEIVGFWHSKKTLALKKALNL